MLSIQSNLLGIKGTRKISHGKRQSTDSNDNMSQIFKLADIFKQLSQWYSTKQLWIPLKQIKERKSLI